jgi:hypothetical protein
MSNPFQYSEIQKDVIADVISLNPTGKIDFSGIFKPNGQTSKVKNTYISSQEKLKKTNANEFVCDNIEQFNNQYEPFQQSCNKSNILGYFVFALILLLIVVVIMGLIKVLFK